ncbi:fructosamine kinase family protein [Aidingimonas lacisalsi]|uniref:fructosamine kinase family protein n=1 Tax=Aidingimonas lacisalsi TaxID=2604086 RepID=UPI0011D2B6B9|nr:fructosamine kinase family protein [Aidingimonas lacisalsi]
MNDVLMSLLETHDIVPLGELNPLSGGDIASVSRLDTDHGPVVVKHDDAERLEGEADGLQALRDAGSSLRVPVVLAVADGWLIMEALESSGPRRRDDAALGEGLRKLHSVVGDTHGWPRNNACGLTPQPNEPMADGRAFQRERRLLPMAMACHERGLMAASLRERIERVADDLERWLEDVPASLIHGDLWSGNVLFTPEGPAVIDPAVYCHYPDVDLAMLTLFGSPGDTFFEAYWNGRRPDDWSVREALFQLYPLLNHLLLFGGAYRGAVERAVACVETG